MTVWLNGRLLPPEAAHVGVADRGLLLGDGVFETVRAVDGVPAHLPRHLARLRLGAAVLGIALPWTDAGLATAAAAVLQSLAADAASVRITLTRGPGPRGVLPTGEAVPTVLVTAAVLPPPAGPAALVIAQSTRRNEASPLSRIKSLNYLDSIIARREAAALGADDAILLDSRGRLAEASAANLFVLLADGTLATPPVGDGALPGIFRARMLESGAVAERTLWPGDLAGAQAVLLGNSLGWRLASRSGAWRFDLDGLGAVRLRRLALQV